MTMKNLKKLNRLGSISMGSSIFALTSLLLGVPYLFVIICDVDMFINKQFPETVVSNLFSQKQLQV
ncbi:unnamed protein product [Strongylus vulgaris]|uniref:Uncharacterized protein n=1 Tax=Strongylus vulgaris TaxID=40348 RepID=A0A3P7IGY6_STRVU|nr:unnamed protein product [Strongylus vulgaris]